MISTLLAYSPSILLGCCFVYSVTNSSEFKVQYAHEKIVTFDDFPPEIIQEIFMQHTDPDILHKIDISKREDCFALRLVSRACYSHFWHLYKSFLTFAGQKLELTGKAERARSYYDAAVKKGCRIAKFKDAELLFHRGKVSEAQLIYSEILEEGDDQHAAFASLRLRQITGSDVGIRNAIKQYFRHWQELHGRQAWSSERLLYNNALYLFVWNIEHLKAQTTNSADEFESEIVELFNKRTEPKRVGVDGYFGTLLDKDFFSLHEIIDVLYQGLVRWGHAGGIIKLSEFYYALEQPKKAEELLVKHQEIDLKVLVKLGSYYEDTKREQEAIDVYEKASLRGSNIAQFKLACLFARKGDLRAINWLTQSAENGNNYASFWLYKYYKKGKFKKVNVPEEISDEKAEYWLTESANSDNPWAVSQQVFNRKTLAKKAETKEEAVSELKEAVDIIRKKNLTPSYKYYADIAYFTTEIYGKNKEQNYFDSAYKNFEMAEISMIGSAYEKASLLKNFSWLCFLRATNSWKGRVYFLEKARKLAQEGHDLIISDTGRKAQDIKKNLEDNLRKIDEQSASRSPKWRSLDEATAKIKKIGFRTSFPQMTVIKAVKADSKAEKKNGELSSELENASKDRNILDYSSKNITSDEIAAEYTYTRPPSISDLLLVISKNDDLLSITELNLCDNDITTKGAVTLLEKIIELLPNLDKVNLSKNHLRWQNDYDDNLFEQLLEKLLKKSSFKYINVARNSLEQGWQTHMSERMPEFISKIII